MLLSWSNSIFCSVIEASCVMEQPLYSPLPEGAASLLPSQARALFRKNAFSGSTSGFCLGHAQANILILPSHLADDCEQFCRLNSAPFPLLYRSKVGDASAPPLACSSDVKYVSNVPGHGDLIIHVAIIQIYVHKFKFCPVLQTGQGSNHRFNHR